MKSLWAGDLIQIGLGLLSLVLETIENGETVSHARRNITSVSSSEAGMRIFFIAIKSYNTSKGKKNLGIPDSPFLLCG